MRIDAHHHLWDLDRRPQPWLTEPVMKPIHRDFGLDDFTAVARAAGVERSILVQVLPDPAETGEFLAAADASDLVAGVVGWADLASPAIADDLAALQQGPGGQLLVGIRHLVQGEADPGWLNRPMVRHGLRATCAAGLAYDLLTLPHQLPAATDTVRALPELTFVLDHLSKPPIASGSLDAWAVRLRELAAEPHVYCKLSGLVTEAAWDSWTLEDLRPYTDVALEAFGPERVMFGSDWPVCLLAAPYAAVVDAAEELTATLTPAERAEVFGGTAARAYRLTAAQRSRNNL